MLGSGHKVQRTNRGAICTAALALDKVLATKGTSCGWHQHSILCVDVAVDGDYASSELLDRLVDEEPVQVVSDDSILSTHRSRLHTVGSQFASYQRPMPPLLRSRHWISMLGVIR